MHIQMKKDNMIGNKFGRLTVMSEKGRDKHRKILYACKCECGNTTVVHGTRLRTGRVLSCGCYRLEKLREKCVTHGKTKSPEHVAFLNMKARCYNESHMYYHNYGGRGITVCDRWLESFENFYADMGDKPFKEAQLDRIDNNGNYEPDNCRWITPHENSLNQRKRHDYGIVHTKSKKYYTAIKRKGLSRISKARRSIEETREIRNKWIAEYEDNPEKWIEDTISGNYDK